MGTKQKLNVAIINQIDMLFYTKTQDIIADMISKDWGFSLNYSDVHYDESVDGYCWEANFFKRGEDGFF